MYYETHDAELFLFDVGVYVEETTSMKSYVKMPDDSKAKYREKVLIELTKQCSPKKNYGISKDVLRAFIGEVLTKLEKQYQSLSE